jgi:hypothetical protein
MTDSEKEKSDHWDLLASELGAEPELEQVEPALPSAAEQPDTTPPPTPAPALPEARSPGDRSEGPPARPHRPAPDWDALASELGLAPRPQVEAPSPVEQPAGAAPAETSPEAAGQTDATRGLAEKGEWPGSLGEQSTAELVEGPAYLVEEPAETAPRPPEAAEAAAQVGEVRTEAPQKKTARRRRKRRRKPRDASRVAADRPDAELVDKLAETQLEEPAGGEPVFDQDQPDKGRAKRRRKRPPARKKKRISATTEAPPERDSAAHQPEEGRRKPEGSVPTAAKPSRLPDEEGEPFEDTRPSKPSHRAIPTWEEAIGLIISANLEARVKNPGGGSSRGRVKGRGPATGPRPRENPPEKKK